MRVRSRKNRILLKFFDIWLPYHIKWRMTSPLNKNEVKFISTVKVSMNANMFGPVHGLLSACKSELGLPFFNAVTKALTSHYCGSSNRSLTTSVLGQHLILFSGTIEFSSNFVALLSGCCTNWTRTFNLELSFIFRKNAAFIWWWLLYDDGFYSSNNEQLLLLILLNQIWLPNQDCKLFRDKIKFNIICRERWNLQTYFHWFKDLRAFVREQLKQIVPFRTMRWSMS